MSILVSKAQQLANLSEIQSAKLASIGVGLIMTNLSPDPETTLAALEAAEATFDGYSRKTAQATTLVMDDAGLCKLVTPNIIYTLTADAVTSNTIYGYFLVTSGSAPSLLSWELLPAPQPMALDGDTLSFVAKYELPAPTGQCVITD